jgi:hypothetical protein
MAVSGPANANHERCRFVIGPPYRAEIAEAWKALVIVDRCQNISYTYATINGFRNGV